MKNIHILSTDKPSRLQQFEGTDGIEFQLCSKDEFFNKGVNIYITSDEETKEGDWFMSDFNSFPIHNIKELSERAGHLGWTQKDLKNNLKIILTTDQDLIKDGVQAIHDEFLEWFVKNPSCDEVEVVQEKLYEIEHYCDDGINVGYNNNSTNFHSYKETLIKNWLKIKDETYYKIIIPKEEPKKYTYKELEEFEKAPAIDLTAKHLDYCHKIASDSLVKQKRMYSEEDMLKFAWYLIKNIGQYSCDETAHFEGKYLEQFKQ